MKPHVPTNAFPRRVAILGCGFTGVRVAHALLDAHVDVVATSRHPQKLRLPGADVVEFDAARPEHLDRLSTTVEGSGALVCSIPTLRLDGRLVEIVPEIMRRLQGNIPRVIYISTTGVYGDQHVIDENSPPKPVTPRETCRAEAEESVLTGCRTPLVLRPAAIYGPGRGVHVSIREGKYRLTGDGSNYISRIHVDDLAAHVLAALKDDVSGAWPVADEHPCSQWEMASFCAELLKLPLPPSALPGNNPETLRANRRVDGSAIRRRLGISLRYPSYREGVPASIAAEIDDAMHTR